MKPYLAEAIGTFFLVFAGTGAVAIDQYTGGGVSHVGIGLTFGLIVMAMIYAIGDVSGAHINPAVTLAFWVARRFPGSRVMPYIASQCAGALAASFVLWLLFGGGTMLGLTHPRGSWGQSFGLEVVLTFLLMFVILNVSTGAKEKGITAGLAIGGTVGLCALFGGPISGASMNPARSLGPAVLTGQLAALWVYLLAPVLGALLAVLSCRCIQDGECCGPSDPSEDTLPRDDTAA